MEGHDDDAMNPVVAAPPPEEHFRGLLHTSRDMVLHILQSDHAAYDHKAFSELQEDLLDATRRTERLVKANLVLPSEVQQAQMILALGQLLPVATLQSLVTSLHQCLDVQTTAKGSLMELVLDPDYNFAQLFTSNSNNNNSPQAAAAAIFQLETHLMAAQPSNSTTALTRPTKRRRRHKLLTEYRASYWKVSLSYVLVQWAYDSLLLLPYPFSVHELWDCTQNLARPFQLHTSDLLCAAHAFFLLDLWCSGAATNQENLPELPVRHSRRTPEGLTLAHVVHELTARRYVE
jgi:hypothetical protein